MVEEEINEILIEWVYCFGKIREDNKLCLIIVKFSFYKDKECILLSVCILVGINYGILQDFFREIVELWKGLVKVMKEVKKNG